MKMLAERDGRFLQTAKSFRENVIVQKTDEVRTRYRGISFAGRYIAQQAEILLN